VRPVCVVVIGVLSHGMMQLTLVDDERAVEQLAA
jgi:hypothetical protein